MLIKNNKGCNIKINDRSIEPCECCEDGVKIYYEDPNVRTKYLRIEDNYLYVFDLEKPRGSQIERVEINYCPICGRKLNENAK
jgi:hypothetical protein